MVPSYLVLVPMLLLLPPATVPLFVAVALVLASVARCLAGRVSAEHILFSVPNAWHALGPALVLVLAGPTHGQLATCAVYLAAFLASGVVDFATSTLRETFALSVAPQLQLRVAAVVYLVDACIAPLGLLLAHVARGNHLALLMALPFSALLWILERERSARIAQAQVRLELVARERTRLQAAVRRLGDAFAAKLDLTALTSIVLHGSLEAMDADAGQLTLEIGTRSSLAETIGEPDHARMLADVGREAQESGRARRLERDGVWALALPISFASDGESGRGALTVTRRAREFRRDEQALLHGLVERAETAICDILGHEALHEQAVTDPLTSLGNRRKLASQLSEQLTGTAASEPEPFLLMLFDLDGFKGYNDTFGHLAGDACWRSWADGWPPPSLRTAPPTGWVGTSSASCFRPTPVSCRSTWPEPPALSPSAGRPSRSAPRAAPFCSPMKPARSTTRFSSPTSACTPASRDVLRRCGSRPATCWCGSCTPNSPTCPITPPAWLTWPSRWAVGWA